MLKVTSAKILFFVERRNSILYSKYLDFCVSHESTNFKICDVILDITAYQKICFLLCLLNAIEYQDETWWNISATVHTSKRMKNLTLIRLGFLRVVFSVGKVGGSQFDPSPPPPSYFKNNLSNINITLYNC